VLVSIAVHIFIVLFRPSLSFLLPLFFLVLTLLLLLPRFPAAHLVFESRRRAVRIHHCGLRRLVVVVVQHDYFLGRRAAALVGSSVLWFAQISYHLVHREFRDLIGLDEERIFV
jgi:hypothetical protein